MFNIRTDFLALDFDGVIADSINECLVVGHNAFVEHLKSGHKIKNLNELHKKEIDEFKRLRNFIRSGEDYVFIQLALHDHEKIEHQVDFDRFSEQNKHLTRKFFDLFYMERDSFSTQQSQLWVELNPLYPGIRELLSFYEPKENLFIITTKKIEFVHKILLANGIPLKATHCYHAHGQKTKLEIILDLLNKYNNSPDHFHFVDDQVDTLIKVKQAGIRCHLARWGYNNPEQLNRAKRAGIPAILLKDFLEQFSSTILDL